ncbi:helix-turn-helix domain-containing protein [Bacillus sp. EAC]|uniref:BglG family transcription antiterminator n=1 Tax=Bacillus sp. EAC TaxID=1978338 RepID=UPI000B43FCCA|nr:helix-turn-helix domain-containing protein [Bacillus sp. EAC]
MDKTSLRRLQLVDFLSNQERWFKTSELALKLKCAEKTIRTDIQSINATFPEGWHIKTLKGKGIYLNNPIHSSLDQIRSLFLKNSLSFQVIEFILIKEISFISELGQVLYTHHNSVYNILKRVDVLLKPYGLILNRVPLQIEGSEFQKRLLCCDVLYGLYSYSNKWPYEIYTFSVIKKVISKTTEKYNLYLYPSTTYKYTYYLGTMLHRIHKGIQLDIHPSNNIKESVFFSIATEVCMQLEKKYKLLIPFNEIIALSLFISSLHYFCNEDLNKNEVVKLYQDQTECIYRELHLLVSLLEKNLDLNLHDNSDFIFTLRKQFKDHSLILYFNKFTPPSPIVDYVLKHYPELYKKVKFSLSKWSIHFPFPELSSEIVARITLSIQAIIIQLNSITKRVLLLTSEGHGVHHYIATKLKTEFCHKIEFVEISNGGFTPENINKLCLDLIIADFQLNTSSVPVATINSTLSHRDINQIARLLKIIR